MFKRAKTALAIGAVGSTAALLVAMQPAFGDPQARPGDAVGVGSDTVQNAADFLFSGDTSGDTAYNNAKTNEVYNYFATGDANGRALYDSTGTLLYGNGTTAAVLRAGTKPVERPDGSGAGIAALTADSLGGAGYDGLPNGSITFARASRLPKGAEQSACAAITDCGGLHVFQFATDNLEIAKSSVSFNGFPLSGAMLLYIYSHCDGNQGVEWSEVPGAPAGASNNHIIPVIPQSGSGTRNFFESDIGLSDTTVTNSTCIRVSEEHDPTGITLATQPGSTTNDAADAIEPFSVGKIKLIQSGYYANSQEPASNFNIALISGCTSGDQTPNCPSADQNKANDGNPVYDSTRGLYFIARDFDLNLTPGSGACLSAPDSTYGECQPSQPGGTKNWVNDLFKGSGSWIARSIQAPDIEAAGLTPNYQDLGDASSG
ncbi:MAG TPA: substrate-binding domain-containing protein [Mycobacteriales bacterium]|nr:substrate-binding domain-containing protein [Mycobacteriales bacterium]